MKWQQALTKAQLKHLRWSVDGETPTLHSFRMLREFQAGRAKVRAEKYGLNSPLCTECDEIEARLKEAGKL